MEQIIKRVDDHEERIRVLEKNYAEMRFNLLSLDKGQTDIKLMVSESNRTLSQLLNKVLDSELGLKKSGQKYRWDLVFKVWVVIGPILTAIAAYAFKK